MKGLLLYTALLLSAQGLWALILRWRRRAWERQEQSIRYWIRHR